LGARDAGAERSQVGPHVLHGIRPLRLRLPGTERDGPDRRGHQVGRISPLIFVSLLALKADPAKQCASCADWNAPQEPFRVFGNTYYVGVAGLSSVLVASDKGLILLDGGLPQSAPLIDASIRKLGFRPEDLRLIVNSHAHFDHAGGIAA